MDVLRQPHDLLARAHLTHTAVPALGQSIHFWELVEHSSEGRNFLSIELGLIINSFLYNTRPWQPPKSLSRHQRRHGAQRPLPSTESQNYTFDPVFFCSSGPAFPKRFFFFFQRNITAKWANNSRNLKDTFWSDTRTSSPLIRYWPHLLNLLD